jgi:glucose/arabinose dehydrogenase
MIVVRTLVLSALVAAALPAAAAVPTGFTQTLITNAVTAPTSMAFAPDGRLFVTQQHGRVRVIKDGALLAANFLSLTVDNSGERGLLGLAFDPDFAINNWVYVYYTVPSPNLHNRVSRFTASGDVAVAGSEVVIFELDALSTSTNHNGGALHFGADGTLFVATGDNASGANAQSFNTTHGKILRINKDGTIPADNPFFATTTGSRRAIWALGLRNPFTFAFDAEGERMFINDVGQNTWEEINDGVAGANYGWPTTEGPTSDARFRGPIHAYAHSGTPVTGCAITGGAFYDASTGTFPAEFEGDYFYGDYCGGFIRRFDAATGADAAFGTGLGSPVDIDMGPDGSLYFLGRTPNEIWRIEYTASQVPAITDEPDDVTVSAGQPATFTVAASGRAPLSYQWQRNRADIPGATSASYTFPSAQPSNDGDTFRCVVTNSAGSDTSREAVLTVTSNRPPVAAITAPVAGSTYGGGQEIAYSGTASDPDGGTPTLTWRVDFHHDEHLHPFVAPHAGTGGAFTVPVEGETSANVWLRIHLTATDAAGASHSVFRDVQPRLSTVIIAALPRGLTVLLDGQPVTTPHTFVGVEGILRRLEAPATATLGAGTYAFRAWSDRGARVHAIGTPVADTTYRARYQRQRRPAATAAARRDRGAPPAARGGAGAGGSMP